MKSTYQDTGGDSPADMDIAAVRNLIEQESTQAPINSAEAPNAQVSHVDAVEPSSQDTPREKMSGPKPRHLAYLVLLGIIVMYPMVVAIAIALILAPIVGLLIYLCFVGVDGFWYRTRATYLRIKYKRPALAKRLRTGFYAGASQWDAMVDRLPGTLPEAAYAPDFQAIAQAEVEHDRALKQRFARLREEMSA